MAEHIHTSFEEMEVLTSLQVGIERAILNTKGKRDILIKDFNSVETTSYPKEGSDTTAPHNLSSFSCKSYASEAFHNLRQQFGIDQEEFIESICLQPLRSLTNPGSSGSLLFISEDDNYILKTVSDKEARFLQQLLPGYWMNIHQNDKTLLPKFFGLFGYQTTLKSTRVVIMNNVLPSSLRYQMKFDLKGSSYNRRVGPSDTVEGLMPVTQKDNDFQERLPKGLAMTSDKRGLLLDALERDCNVLESFEIMDYSLLVGVHNVSQVLKEAEEKVRQNLSPVKKPRSILRSRMSIDIDKTNYDSPLIGKRSVQLATHLASVPEGGFPAKLPNGDFVILFVGAIDILQNFRVKKRIEHSLKSIVIEKETISVQKPSFYAKRFLKFMRDEVFVEQSRASKRVVRFGSVRRSSLVEVSSFDEEERVLEDIPHRPGSAEGERKMGMLKRQSTVQTDEIFNSGEHSGYNDRERREEAIQRARKTLKMSRQSAVEDPC